MISDAVPFFTMINVYMSLIVLIAVGHISDMLTCVFFYNRYQFRRRGGYVPIYSRMESLYIRRAYTRISDCFNRPITGYPTKYLSVLDRKYDSTQDRLVLSGRTLKLLNFGSYNYLGLARADSPVSEKVLRAVDALPASMPVALVDSGAPSIVCELEREVASFLGVDGCLVFPMGFSANSCTIPVFTDEGDLIISDEYNHTSIIYGARLSRATVKTFPHNNMAELEKTLRYWISQGQPATHKAWKRVFLIVESIYSMEGTVLRLKKVLELKQRYKFYLFVDEAHSIGAIGKTGRGICEYFGVEPRKIDILMGTFSKSFNGVGGYVAGGSKIVGFLRARCDSTCYGEQMSPIVAKQVLEALRYLKSAEGARLPGVLRKNSIYMRRKLIRLGYVVAGGWDSPIVPVMIFNLGKIGEFSRLCKERGLAVVVVGYPATTILTTRVRLCMSAAHTRKDIDVAISIIDEVGKILGMNVLAK